MIDNTKKVTDDRDLALARGFGRCDEDPRPISEISEAELLAGFGAVVPTHL